MTNRLVDETSPYLLQHAHNPVHWYPWGPEAHASARQQDKPIFLSIGYSACHWCHVMERESFENPTLAALLNEHFVCIKVDREERPDLDQIYMQAVQMMTGHGGWPMSVFLTPDHKPFFGGTYWPPQARGGMPGFGDVLTGVADAWRNRRSQALNQADQLTAHLVNVGRPEKGEVASPEELLHSATAKMEQSFDFAHGGFGGAPKFPHAMNLQLLMRNWFRWRRQGVLDMVTMNLDKMAHGGIYDHLGGGFARYTVDERWLVPHFEKMLYDNSLLARAYVEAFQVTGNVEYRRVACETLDYVLRDMTDTAGGFYSAEDADSEGEEGKFYVWSLDEVRQVLGPERSDRFCYVFDVTEGGNFEGHNILNLPKTLPQCAAIRGWDLAELQQELATDRANLLAARSQRVRPARDDKILVSWNGLMIDALAYAGSVFGESRYVDAAERAARFLWDHFRQQEGRLLHVWCKGQARYQAYLDGYACLTNALVTLYEATFNESWIDHAVSLADQMMRHFRDRDSEGFFYTADDHEALITRTHDLHDSSVPSATATAITALLRLGHLCGRADYLHAARGALDAATKVMEQAPTATAQLLMALDMQWGPFYEIVMLGNREHPDVRGVLSDLRRRYMPHHVLAARDSEDIPDGSIEIDPIFTGKHATEAMPTVYACQDFTCGVPQRGPHQVANLWQKLTEPTPHPGLR